MNLSVLQEMALELIRDASEDSLYHASTIDKRSENLISTHVSTGWVRRFMDHFNSVNRDQTKKLMCSPTKEKKIEESVVVFLDEMCGDFQVGGLDGDTISNMD